LPSEKLIYLNSAKSITFFVSIYDRILLIHDKDVTYMKKKIGCYYIQGTRTAVRIINALRARALDIITLKKISFDIILLLSNTKKV